MRRPMLTLPVLVLAACVTDDPSATPAPAPSKGDCGAADLQTLVGQSAAVLETMRFSQPVRVIRPGQAVTMDYRADRLNIEVDASERIFRVACG